jgi:hypothetical protein
MIRRYKVRTPDWAAAAAIADCQVMVELARFSGRNLWGASVDRTDRRRRGTRLAADVSDPAKLFAAANEIESELGPIGYSRE